MAIPITIAMVPANFSAPAKVSVASHPHPYLEVVVKVMIIEPSSALLLELVHAISLTSLSQIASKMILDGCNYGTKSSSATLFGFSSPASNITLKPLYLDSASSDSSLIGSHYGA
jgi:hypothetical protein